VERVVYDLNCEFCKLVTKEVKSYIVFEDEISLAFLDIKPLFPGHILLIPKNHFETFADIPVELIAPLFRNAKLLDLAVEKALKADGSFIAINNRISQSVSHLHIHIVPRRKGDGLKGFFWPRYPYKDKDEMVKIQQIIKDTLKSLNI